jgi:hypothetical protein
MMSSRHIGEPLYSRSPHPTRRAAVRSFCGRAVRARIPETNIWKEVLSSIEWEQIDGSFKGLCQSCVKAFKVSVHYSGEMRRRIEGEMQQ